MIAFLTTHPAPKIMSLLRNAQFVLSAHNLRDLPAADGIEIAFAGRSNAGKSSALNSLVRHQRLAFVSKQPGRTQLINFFQIAEQRYLVDLPGYGYAKVPAMLREHWRHVLSHYLGTRTSVHGLVLVMDSRHPLTALDRQMLDWFCPSGRPLHVLLTKADKLSRGVATLTQRAVGTALLENWQNKHGNSCTCQLFSSLNKQGIDEAEAVINSWLYA